MLNRPSLYIVAVIVLAPPAAALAHSWYPYECCSNRDCHPVACEALIDGPDGSLRYGRTVFLKQQIRPSQDGDCHVCINQYGNGLCAFILQGS
jgi:hypothetical protein